MKRAERAAGQVVTVPTSPTPETEPIVRDEAPRVEKVESLCRGERSDRPFLARPREACGNVVARGRPPHPRREGKTRRPPEARRPGDAHPRPARTADFTARRRGAPSPMPGLVAAPAGARASLESKGIKSSSSRTKKREGKRRRVDRSEPRSEFKKTWAMEGGLDGAEGPADTGRQFGAREITRAIRRKRPHGPSHEL